MMQQLVLAVALAHTSVSGRVSVIPFSIAYKNAEICLEHRQKEFDKFEGKYSFVYAECAKSEVLKNE